MDPISRDLCVNGQRKIVSSNCLENNSLTQALVHYLWRRRGQVSQTKDVLRSIGLGYGSEEDRFQTYKVFVTGYS